MNRHAMTSRSRIRESTGAVGAGTKNDRIGGIGAKILAHHTRKQKQQQQQQQRNQHAKHQRGGGAPSRPQKRPCELPPLTPKDLVGLLNKNNLIAIPPPPPPPLAKAHPTNSAHSSPSSSPPPPRRATARRTCSSRNVMVKRSVSFDKVKIREHARMLVDHPYCQDGLSLGIDWSHSDRTIVVDVDLYESIRQQRRRKTPVGGNRLGPFERMFILKSVGYNDNHLLEAYLRANAEQNLAPFQQDGQQFLAPPSP